MKSHIMLDLIFINYALLSILLRKASGPVLVFWELDISLSGIIIIQIFAFVVVTTLTAQDKEWHK